MRFKLVLAIGFLLLFPAVFAAGTSDDPAKTGPGNRSVGLLIQDNLPNVTTDAKAYRNFVRSLPEGTRVTIAYARPGKVEVAVPLTTDLDKAADALRAPSGFAQLAPGSPFLSVKEFIKQFPESGGDSLIVFVSDGIDSNYGDLASPYSGNPYLAGAINAAKKKGVRVDTIFAPSSRTGGYRTSVGQGTLNYLSEKTGGEGYYSGSTYVSAEPFLEDILKGLSR